MVQVDKFRNIFTSQSAFLLRGSGRGIKADHANGIDAFICVKRER